MSMLPSDPRFQAMQDALERQRLLYESSQGSLLQQKLSDLTAQEALANEQAPRNEAGALANFGSRGMAYSSGYLNNLGDLKSALARKIGAINTEGTNAKNTYLANLQKFLSDYISQQGQINSQQAQWADQNLANVALADVLKKRTI
jgi:hypothetical protein